MNPRYLVPVGVLRALKGFEEFRRRVARARGVEAALVREALRTSAESLAGIDSLDQWLEQRDRFRGALAWMLGLRPEADRQAPPCETTGVVERRLYIIQKIVLETLPGLLVTANYYLPKGINRPPCVLYLCGHWPSLAGAKTGFQDRYLWYPEHGFALLVLDPLQFGEVPGVHHGTSRLNRWDWISLAYTPAGVEVFNAMRAIDWLESQPDVDASRLAATGVSGGGVMTQFLTALDDRIRVAVASCSTYTIGTQAELGLVPDQCDCTFYPNLAHMDFPVVLALIAPKPLLVLGGRRDPIFPPRGFRAAVERARRIYDLHETRGGGSRLRLLESSDGHTDTPAFLEATRRWIAEGLGVSERPPEESYARAHPAPEAPSVLRCLDETPPSALNYHVESVWIQSPAPVEPEDAGQWQQRRSEIVTMLREKVFGWFPWERSAVAERRLGRRGGFAGEMCRYEEIELETEAQVWIRVQVLSPRGVDAPIGTVLWVRAAMDHVGFPDLDELLPLLAAHRVAIVTPRLADHRLDGRDRARIERTALLVGRSIAAMQVWDALQVVSWLEERGPAGDGGLAVYGRGEAGIVALYAAVMDQRVGHVILRDPPATHFRGPAVPAVLRWTDIPEVAATLAPRRLTIVPALSGMFHATRRLFDLTGATGSIGGAPSVAEAVLGTADDPMMARGRL